MLAFHLVQIAQILMLVNGLISGGITRNSLPSRDEKTLSKERNAASGDLEVEARNGEKEDVAKQVHSDGLFGDCYENNSLGNFAWSNWRRKSQAAPQMKQWAESVVHMIQALDISTLPGDTIADKFYLYTAANEVLGDPLYHRVDWYWKCWMFHSNDPVPSGDRLTVDMQRLLINNDDSFAVYGCGPIGNSE